MSRLNSQVYYRLSSNNYGVNSTMNCGPGNPPANVSMMERGKNDGDNWQFFYQDGVYFIRSYDYNTTYHLAVNGSYPSYSVVMAPATGSLRQQWLVESWDAAFGAYSDNSGAIGYRITNVRVALQHPEQQLGVGYHFSVPIMESVLDGAKWTFQQNLDLPSVGPDMLQAIPQSAIPTAPMPSATSPPTSQSSSAGTLRTLDKVGIAVGVTVSVLLIAFVCWAMYRYKKYGYVRTKGVPGPIATLRRQLPREQEEGGEPRHGYPEIVAEPTPAYPHARSKTSIVTSPGATAEYYARNGTRAKAADEESIELPTYGSPSVETKSFV